MEEKWAFSNLHSVICLRNNSETTNVIKYFWQDRIVLKLDDSASISH